MSVGVGLADELPRDTNEIKTLTVEQAEALLSRLELQRGFTLFLDGLTTITPEVAEALAKYKYGLFLNGLTTITPEVAEALAKYEGEYLYLSDLTTITPEALKILRANPDINVPLNFDE